MADVDKDLKKKSIYTQKWKQGDKRKCEQREDEKYRKNGRKQIQINKCTDQKQTNTHTFTTDGRKK